MRFITIREPRGKSTEIQRELPKEKEMVLTSNGKPIDILTAIFLDKIEKFFTIICRLRAMEAVKLYAKTLCRNRC